LVCVVLATARRLPLEIIDTVLACTFTFFSQVSVTTILGNDTLSQAASALFGYLSAFFLYIAFFDRPEELKATQTSYRLVWSVACYAMALFCKETALGFLVVALILIGIVASRKPVWSDRLKRALLLSGPFIAVTLVYAVARRHAGGHYSESGIYHMGFGFNVIHNIAEFSLAAFGPFSTVSAAVASQTGNKSYLISAALGWMFVAATVVGGILISTRKRLILCLSVCALASLFPTYLLSHVSELYLYNAVPFLSLIVGIALGSLFRRNRWAQIVAITCAALLIGAQVYADRQKAELMTQNGRSAASMMAVVAQFMKDLPANSEILLVNAAERKPEYSVFVLKGFDVLDYGTYKVGPLLGRRDVNVRIINKTDARKLTPQANVLMLELAGDRMRLYTPGTRE
jgi:hypothetical protein